VRKVGGQQIWGLVEGLLELVFWPLLPKCRVGGQVGSVARYALRRTHIRYIYTGADTRVGPRP
jgi:hypothetical protein